MNLDTTSTSWQPLALYIKNSSSISLLASGKYLGLVNTLILASYDLIGHKVYTMKALSSSMPANNGASVGRFVNENTWFTSYNGKELFLRPPTMTTISAFNVGILITNDQASSCSILPDYLYELEFNLAETLNFASSIVSLGEGT
jgi:hypothetical protein